MAIEFVQATKHAAKLRLALVGPSGAGKTYTALAIASGLGKNIAVVDTEAGSAELYSDIFPFKVLKLDSFHPQNYIDAISAAAAADFDVIVLDSLSHAWIGKDGELQLVDRATAASRSKNQFTDGWREVSPLHNALIDSMIRAPIHLIATMRTKTEYVVEKDERTGKSAPRKIGLAPVQRAGLEYEFTVVADIDLDHNFIVSKTRCNLLDGAVVRKAGADIAETLKEWLDAGEPNPELERPDAKDKKQLAKTIEALSLLDDSRDWAATAEAYAQREFKHPLDVLAKPDFLATVRAMNAFAEKLAEQINEDAAALAAATAAAENATKDEGEAMARVAEGEAAIA